MKKHFKKWLSDFIVDNDLLDEISEHLETRLEEYDTRDVPYLTVLELKYNKNTTEPIKKNLHEQLQEAIEREDYEEAEKIQNEIDRL